MLEYSIPLKPWLWIGVGLLASNCAFGEIHSDDGTAAVPSFLTQDLIEVFEAGTYTFNGESVDGLIRYRLFKPSNQKSGSTIPIIVWLHGFGSDECDNINLGQLKYLQTLIFNDPKHPEKYPFFFFAPQLPKNYSSWSFNPSKKQTADGQIPLDAVMGILDDLIAKEPIDRDRIYLAGVSAGATDCWNLAIRYPEVFAAVAPLASQPSELERMGRLCAVPIWAFHSTDDHPELVRTAIAALNSLGGYCTLTEIPGSAHNCWNEAFTQYGLLGWLLERRRGSPITPRPSWITRGRLLIYETWPQALTIGIAATCLLMWRRRTYRRRSGMHDKIALELSRFDPFQY